MDCQCGRSQFSQFSCIEYPEVCSSKEKLEPLTFDENPCRNLFLFIVHSMFALNDKEIICIVNKQIKKYSLDEDMTLMTCIYSIDVDHPGMLEKIDSKSFLYYNKRSLNTFCIYCALTGKVINEINTSKTIIRIKYKNGFALVMQVNDYDVISDRQYDIDVYLLEDKTTLIAECILMESFDCNGDKYTLQLETWKDPYIFTFFANQIRGENHLTLWKLSMTSSPKYSIVDTVVNGSSWDKKCLHIDLSDDFIILTFISNIKLYKVNNNKLVYIKCIQIENSYNFGSIIPYNQQNVILVSRLYRGTSNTETESNIRNVHKIFWTFFNFLDETSHEILYLILKVRYIHLSIGTHFYCSLNKKF